MSESIQTTSIIDELRESLLWDVIDQSQHSLVITDNRGTILYVNDYFCQISGYTKAELIGGNQRILKSSVHSDNFFSDLWETVSANQVWNGQICNQNKSGEVYWEDVTIYPIAYKDQDYFVGIKRDITAQITAQTQLKEAKKTLQGMIDAVTETLLLVNREAHPLIGNTTVADRFGMTLPEFLQKSAEELLPADIINNHLTAIKTVFETGDSVDMVDMMGSRHMRTLFYPVFDDAEEHIENVVIFARDITQEVEYTTRLQESEKLHRAILDTISDAVFITDDDGNLTFVCPNIHQIFGYTKDEVKQMGTIDSLLGHVDIPEAELRIHGELQNIEIEITDKQGQTHTLLVNVKAVHINGGTRLYSCRNISEHKRTEDDLRYHSLVLSQVSDAIILTDLDFNIFSLNPAAEAIYGWQSDDVIGQNWGELIPVTYKNTTRNDVIATFRNLGYWSGEVIQQNRQGKKLHIMASVNVIRDSKDNPIGVVSVNRDITHRVKTESALRAGEKRFRRALEYAPFPIMLHADDGEVILINKEWTYLSGYTHDDIPTISAWTKRAYGNTQHEVQQIIANLHDTGQKTDEGIFAICTADNRTLLWDFQSAPLDKLADGRRVMMSIAVDITQRVKLQEQATKAQILEAELMKERELSMLKERLMSTISHEFRTPLTVIQTSSDLLELYFDKLDEEKRKRHLKRITEQVKSATHLLDETMRLRHASSGRIEFVPASIDIEMYAQTIFDKMRFADNNLHQMQFNIDIDNPNIHVDINLLEHIIQNLLSNALKYTPEGKCVDFSITQDENNTYLIVEDEGIGIPEADLKRLFEPYHRAGNVSNIQGTGLGLAIVKEYVELHRGTISCESQLNQGSTFVVTLPLKI